MPVEGFLVSKSKEIKLVFSEEKLDLSSVESLESCQNVVSLEENVPGKLYFIGNEEARVYIDNARLSNGDTDYLINDADSNTVYFHPNRPNSESMVSKYRCFYLYQNNSEKDIEHSNREKSMRNYGPGIYQIKINERGQTTKYTYLLVSPKFLTDYELIQMRQDVENTIIGLSRIFEGINNGMLSSISKYQNVDIIQKIEFLHDREKKFRISLYELIKEPRLKITKSYHWSHKNFNYIDENSLKKLATHPERGREVYAFTRYTKYNIQDNQVIKNDLELLNINLNELIHFMEHEKNKNKNQRSQYSSLEIDYKMLCKYKSLVVHALGTSFLANISSKSANLSYSAMMNRSYSSVDSISKFINQKNNHQDMFLRQYAYDWLRTQDLYEVWGFIHIVQVLTSMGLVPTDGWLVNSDYDVKQILEYGTYLDFKLFGENKDVLLKIKIQYNVNLSKSPKDGELLWANSRHNKPDIIITVQDIENTLVGAIVLDTKYRRLESVYAGEARYQLLAYRDSIKSERYLNSAAYKKHEILAILNLDAPVLETIVLYPKSNHNTFLEHNANQVGINPIELRTGISDAIIKNDLAKQFVNCLLKLRVRYENNNDIKRRINDIITNLNTVSHF